MKTEHLLSASSAMLKKAKEFGATLAGFANVKDLKIAPSYTFAPKMPGVGEGIGSRDNELGLAPGEVAWPENAKSVLVIAVEHPVDKPEMDWWFGLVDPPGNRILARVIGDLCNWIEKNYDIGIFHLPYHIEKGGIYLKDSAVMAGLGCIGKNNILVTPEYGPRVRLRALTLDVAVPSTGPIPFDPCSDCNAPCRKACPQSAFGSKIYSSVTYGQDRLPGRNGVYARPACNIQMEDDYKRGKEQKVEGFDAQVKVIKYCRNCELACPVGKSS
jgi:epoxyqueuosine reductase